MFSWKTGSFSCPQKRVSRQNKTTDEHIEHFSTTLEKQSGTNDVHVNTCTCMCTYIPVAWEKDN